MAILDSDASRTCKAR